MFFFVRSGFQATFHLSLTTIVVLVRSAHCPSVKSRADANQPAAEGHLHEEQNDKCDAEKARAAVVPGCKDGETRAPNTTTDSYR